MKIRTVFAGLWVLGILGFPSLAGAALLGSEFPISSAPYNQRDPLLAYDPVNRHFLAVWEDERNQSSSFWDIYGQLITATGTLVGGEIPITTAPYWQRNPSVAYDPVSQRFLIAWDDDRSSMSSYRDVYGQIIDSTGGFVGGEFSIPTVFTNDQLAPSVACDPVSQRYLVVWADNRGGSGSDIYGRLISASGTFIGGDFPISAAPFEQIVPSIAYDSVNQRFLVAWWDNRNWPGSIYGQLVNVSGALEGGEILIAAGAFDFIGPPPVMTFDPVNQNYFIVWGDTSTWPPYVFGQFMTASGALMGGKISISNPPNDPRPPSVAFDPVTQRFLVVWADYRSGSSYDIYGQRVRANGTLTGGNFSISTAFSDQLSPSVAFDPVTQRFLVVWADYRSGSNYDIYGRMVIEEGGIATRTLPDGFVSVPYSAALQATLGTLPYEWAVTSGALPPGLTLSPSTGGISGLPTTSGAFSFFIRVADADGFTDTAGLTITINPNQAPVVALMANPLTGTAPLQVAFTATASDPDGSIVEYRWDFTGDGIVDITTTTEATSFIYTMAGVFTVAVAAVDNLGAAAQASETITVYSNQAPVVALMANPLTGTAPLQVAFTATASDPDGSIVEYRWDFTGDGTIDMVTYLGGATFTYTVAGAYLAKVTAMDNLGTGTTAYALITVASPPEPGNQSPMITLMAGPTIGPPPLSVAFTATASDPDGSIVEYRWDFTGDGTPDLLTSEGSAVHTYSSSGIYLAVVSAADDKGATAFAYSIINVTVPPTITERVIEREGCGCTLTMASSSESLLSTLALAILPPLFALRMKKRRKIRKNC